MGKSVLLHNCFPLSGRGFAESKQSNQQRRSVGSHRVVLPLCLLDRSEISPPHGEHVPILAQCISPFLLLTRILFIPILV